MLDFLLISMLCLIWGSTWLGIKIGLEDSPPFLSSAARFLIASSFLYILIRIKRLTIPKNNWSKIIIPGFLSFGLSYGLDYWGIQYIASGLAAVLFASLPFFMAIFAHYMLQDEKLSWIKLLFLSLGFLGVVIIFWDQIHFTNSFKSILGMLAVIGAAISAGLSGVFTKRDLHAVDPIVIACFQMIVGTIFLLLVGFSFEKLSDFKITSKSMGALIYLAFFGSILAFVTYFWLLKRIEATKLSLIAFVTPMLALILGALVKQEKITPNLLLGSFFVILGIVGLNFLSPKTKS